MRLAILAQRDGDDRGAGGADEIGLVEGRASPNRRRSASRLPSKAIWVGSGSVDVAQRLIEIEAGRGSSGDRQQGPGAAPL